MLAYWSDQASFPEPHFLNDLPRFYLPTTVIAGSTIALPREVAHHVLVRRLSIDDRLTLFNGLGGEFEASIGEVVKSDVICFVHKHIDREAEPPFSVTLAQSITSSEKMDWTIEKAVELGVTDLVPLSSERSVVRLTAERIERRHAHWTGIIQSSCEQCGRNTLPSLLRLQTFREFMIGHSGKLRLIASPRARAHLADVITNHAVAPDARSVTLVIGPEGGFTDTEEAFAIERGYQPISLGPRVVRTETAGPTALAMLNALWRDYSALR
jgi:16S rRNA (uracil1498-N3)-methyltransferase